MIDESQAIEVCRQEAEAQGWAFVEPVDCHLRKTWRGAPKHWDVRTNAGHLGAIARFVVDACDGRVLEKGYVPR